MILRAVGITGELWQRSDGARLFEVSIKVPVVQAAAASAGSWRFWPRSGPNATTGSKRRALGGRARGRAATRDQDCGFARQVTEKAYEE